MTANGMGEDWLLTPAEMAEADRITIAGGVSGYRLMEAAGYAVADVVGRRLPQGARVVVVCGAGNNGGDGLVAARVLRRRGYRVETMLALPDGRSAADLRGDAARAYADHREPVVPADADVIARAPAIVDALYGAGLSRAIEGADRAIIAAIAGARAAGALVFAVDLPSGVDGRSGEIRGAAVAADETITFFRRKPGHLLMPGRRLCGHVTVADIGIGAGVLAAIAPRTRVNGPGVWHAAWPAPGADDHKYSRGACLVASGPAHACGAARLAAEAALRVGAGLVAVAAPADAVPVVAAYRAAFVVRPVERGEDIAGDLADRRLRGLVAGPGLGIGARGRAIVAACLAAKAPAVFDADALTIMAEDVDAAFRCLADRGGPAVLTPHEGEFARLFPDLDGPRIDRARAAAARAGAVVLLKGPDTVIAVPGGDVAINDNAPPTLATAGSGDVLAGLIGGLLAQGVPAFEAAAMGAHIHGRAGQAAGRGAIADDIAAAVRAVMAEGPPDLPALGPDAEIADYD